MEPLTQVQINLIIIISLWSLPWKGVALWKSAQKQQKTWFIVLMLLNTIGVLEILYIFVFSKIKKQETNSTPIKAPPTSPIV
ncbi:MAG TPA: DUF5652 family protein [bacterium]|mgnify:CR=1 FL=1|jgi:hypothetical protein|nr:DUF5652 family protein [bacterium]HOG38455.1 DUF5652 family protein [bacterium]